MANERVEHIDVAAGIMILWMMLGHVGGASELGFINPHWMKYLERLFFFFMPWFFYKSGMFFAQKPTRITGGGKLLRPFVIWSFVGYVVYSLIQIIWGVDTLKNMLLIRPLETMVYQNYILCNAPLWFLLTLFFVINISNMALKFIHPLILSIVGIILGYGLSLTHNDYIPDILANTAMGICFFSFGYWMKNKETNKWFVFVAIIGYIFATLLLHSPFVDMRINQCRIDRSGFDYLIWTPASICGIIVLNSICKMVVKVYNFPLLQHIGKNAMTYYIVHYMVFYTLGYVLSNVFNVMDGRLLWWLTLSVGAVIIPIICESLIREKEKK